MLKNATTKVNWNWMYVLIFSLNISYAFEGHKCILENFCYTFLSIHFQIDVEN